MTAERPTNLKEALNALSNEELKGIISWADTRSRPAPAQPGLAPASPAVVSPPSPEHPAPRKGFVEEIDDLLASGEGPTRKIPVTLQRLARYLQTLPLPQGASLQNLNIEILDGRSVRAQGKISKMGTSDFVVMLGAGQDGGELKVVSTGLTNVAFTHRGSKGEIIEHLGNLIPDLQEQLDSQIADKTWKATGFSISPDQQELVINFENGEIEKARKDLAGTGVNSLKDWIRDFNLERPKLADLARPALQKQGMPELSQEQLDEFAPKWVNWLAERIVRGRVPPGDSATLELFALIHEADVQAIKDKVKEKLAAGDTSWASAWRSYLETPATAATEPAATSSVARRDALVAQLPNLPPDAIEGIAQRERQRAELFAREMSEYILGNKVLPTDDTWHQINGALTNEVPREALRNQIAAKVQELAEKRESLSQEEQTWLEAWEKELAGSSE